jgi:glycosyltransferase involved in cell wall biosynthesis
MYRLFWPIEELVRRGHAVHSALVPDGSKLPPISQFFDCDVVWMWQLHHPTVRRFMKDLQDSGVAVVWDSDDDVTAVPRGATSYRRIGGFQGQRLWAEMQAMIRIADIVTTPSEGLAGIFRRAGQPDVQVVENYVREVVRPRSSRRGGGVVVGWIAGGEHQFDVGPLRLREAVLRLLAGRSDVVVETVGVTLDVDDPRYRRTGVVPFQDLAGFIQRFDIGLAPLADTRLNRSRSSIKVKEYAAAGVPWLASSLGPYAGLGEEHGGRLVADDDWFDAMHELVDDRKARKRLSGRGHRWASGQTIRGNADQWGEVLERAVARARVRKVSVGA